MHLPAFILAFMATLVLIPLVRALAFRIGLVDKPDERKHHEGAVPPVGGLVMFPVLIIAVILSGGSIAEYGYLFIALIILLAMGAIDDFFALPARAKFAVQVFVAFFVVLFAGARVYTLGDIFSLGETELGWLSIPFSVAAVALLVNSINLIDGLDGLAAGQGFAALSWLIVAAMVAGNMALMPIMMPLAGVLLAFLFYNMRAPWRKKASVFLGDAGSMGLGLVLAWLCIVLTQKPYDTLEPISIAWLLAFPIMDACGQFYRRVREGRHPFSPDRGHFHHHFIHAGISAGRSTALILLFAFVMGGAGYLLVLAGLPQIVVTILWTGLLLAHMRMAAGGDYPKLLSRLRG